MPNFCTKCGKEIENGKAFCSSCGTPIKTSNNIQENSNTIQNINPQPQFNQTASNIENTINTEIEKYDVVKTSYYFWMMLLYAIPIIGWLICIITIFATKNKSKKNFSKAILIWLIVGLIFSLIISLVIGWVGNKIKNYILDATGEYNIVENMQDLDLDEYLKNQTVTNDVQNTSKDQNETNEKNNNISVESTNSSENVVTDADLESVTELLKMIQQLDKASN